MAKAVREAYRAGEDDETLEPRVLVDLRGNAIGRFQDGDYVIFYNLRGEREVELCQSLLDPDFPHFPVKKDLRLNMVTMTPYHQKLNARVAFSPEEEIRHTLSETLSRHGLKQVKISESEKAVHVSFFLNGKIREPFSGEERIAVPTPKDVPQFDQKPEMNAAGVADGVIQCLQDQQVSFCMTTDELITALQSGKTLEQVAEEAGADYADVEAAIQEARQTEFRDRIQQAVTDGTMSQEKADGLLEGLEKGFLGGLDGDMPFGGMHGKGIVPAPSAQPTATSGG